MAANPGLALRRTQDHEPQGTRGNTEERSKIVHPGHSSGVR